MCPILLGTPYMLQTFLYKSQIFKDNEAQTDPKNTNYFRINQASK